MSIRYQHPNDELSYNPWISDGSDDGWWAGVQKCAATVAIAATLAVSTLATTQNIQQTTWAASQDDPVGLSANFIIDDEPWGHRLYNPHLRVYSASGDGSPFSLDEDFWKNPVAPVQASNLVQLPFLDKDDAPTGTLQGHPDEDFWKNPVQPTVNPSYWPQPWIFETNDAAGSLAIVHDEDYWLHLAPENDTFPVWYFIDDSYVVTPPAFSPDEDYWQVNFVVPNHKVYGRSGGSGTGTIDDEPYQQTTLADFGYKVTLWIDDSSTIQQPLPLDEDYWQNPVAPVAFYPGYPAIMDDAAWVPFNPVTPLPFDEEFWPQANAVVPISAHPVPKVFGYDDTWVPFVGPATIPFDEEPGRQFLSLDAPNAVTLWIDDSPGIPIPTFSPEEDFWQNPTPPAIAQFAILQPWIFETNDPAGSLHALPDEDFWQNPVLPVPYSFGRIYLPDTNDDPAGFFEGLQDEDFWQNPVQPIVAANYVKLPLVPDPDEIPAGKLSGQPDEDYWLNWVQPVSATLGKLYLPDGDDVPVGALKGQPDEDFWINSVASISSYPVPFVYTDREEIPAHSLYGQPDEDFWQNPVLPVPYTFGKMYAPNLDDIPAGSFHGTFEDDSWMNPVLPISGFVPPVAFRDDEITVPPAPISYDEDFWQNPVVPVAAAEHISLPYLPDPEEIPAGHLVPPPPPNPCPCSGIPNIPKDRVYDIVLCDQGFIKHIHTWLACIFAQPGSLLAQHMGASIVTLYVYGTQAQAFAEARQFVNHNMGTQ